MGDFHTDRVVGRPLLWTFRNQTKVGYLLTFLVGASIFALVYTYLVAGPQWDLSLLVRDGRTPMLTRRNAAQKAMIACCIWYAIAFMIGKGGPFINCTIFPLISSQNIYAVPIILLGSYPSRPIAQGYTISSPDLAWAVFFVLLPGVILALVMQGCFLLSLMHIFDAKEAWEKKHMPDEFHETQRNMEEIENQSE